jgi:hypothetical protein
MHRDRTLGDGGARTDVIAPSPGELFSETNDNSLWPSSSPTARVLRGGDAKARKEQHSDLYTRP